VSRHAFRRSEDNERGPDCAEQRVIQEHVSQPSTGSYDGLLYVVCKVK
jgi:hypothetical protein